MTEKTDLKKKQQEDEKKRASVGTDEQTRLQEEEARRKEEEEKRAKQVRRLIIWTGFGVFACWIIGHLPFRFLVWKDGSISPGEFGDTLGWINSLFSGFAFWGVIVAILLQREELRHQREELELTRKANQQSVKGLFVAAYLDALSTLHAAQVASVDMSDDLGKMRGKLNAMIMAMRMDAALKTFDTTIQGTIGCKDKYDRRIFEISDILLTVIEDLRHIQHSVLSLDDVAKHKQSLLSMYCVLEELQQGIGPGEDYEVLGIKTSITNLLFDEKYVIDGLNLGTEAGEPLARTIYHATETLEIGILKAVKTYLVM